MLTCPHYIKVFTMAYAVCLTGCSTVHPIAQPCIPIEIPVTKYCEVTIPPKPDYKFDKTTASDLLTVRIKDLMTDKVLSNDYEQTLETLLRSCVQ